VTPPASRSFETNIRLTVIGSEGRRPHIEMGSLTLAMEARKIDVVQIK
jgi:hypothetical protein